MRSEVPCARCGVRNSFLLLARGVLGHLARLRPAATVVVALALAGCAADCWEPYDASLDAADAAAAPKPRAKAKASAAQAARPQLAKAKIPVPGSALLTPQADPRCEETKSTASLQPAKADPKRVASAEAGGGNAGAAPTPGETAAAGAANPSAPADANRDLALRIKLEYERECYRQAELRARNRLGELQKSVGATIKAVEAQNH